MLVDLHDSSLIAAAVTVIRRAKNGNHIPILTPIVALHHQLMSSCNQRQPIVMVECFTDVLAESVTCSSWAYTPATSVIWIGPEQVTHGSFVWDFLDAVETANVIEGINAR